MADKNTLDLARQWAADINADRQTLSQDTIDAAADLISSLPDEWVDADKLQKVIGRWSTEPLTSETAPYMVEQLRELLPAPTPPTLADMTPEEREACVGMQADVESVDDDYRSVIAYVSETVADIVVIGGRVGSAEHSEVTPLPELPRMEWPASALDERAPESAAPRPEDVPVGEPWQVEVNGKVAIGYRNDPDTRLCWAVVCRDDDSGHHWLYDTDVTLIARLVPETTEQEDAEQDDEPEPDPAYTYGDRDGDEWEYIDGRWICGDTHAERVDTREGMSGHESLLEVFGPYTRIEASQ